MPHCIERVRHGYRGFQGFLFKCCFFLLLRIVNSKKTVYICLHIYKGLPPLDATVLTTLFPITEKKAALAA